MSLNENSSSEIADFISYNGSQMDDNLISACRNSLEIPSKSSDDLENFSSRINMLNNQYSSKTLSKSSFLLLAKQYPNYQHYSHRMSLFNRYRKIPESYKVLPEIKGHTLNNADREDQNSKQIHDNISIQINTLKDLTNSILSYGGKSDGIWMKFPSTRNGQKLVRPGFSARRYMANLVRHLNDNLVEKLIADGKILEKTIFQSSLILPHIRRRLSADLSRYPEPYRILKQMLISPGPLNEFSFIWTKKNKSEYLSQDGSFDQATEMDIGDIKILSKKKLENNNEVFEEIQYTNMSHAKKKTVLSNLLLKSAMNHALKIKEEMIEHNSQNIDKTTKDNVHNIHIPIIHFDMREAVTDLLNKETFQMLSCDVPLTSGQIGFKGQALKTGGPKEIKISEFQENFTLETLTNSPMISADQVNSSENNRSVPTINLLPNLTLRLNFTNVNKSTNLFKKKAKLETHSELQSSSSTSHNTVITFDPATFGLTDFQAQQEAHSIAFVEKLKNKPLKSGAPHDKIHPYGKYKNSNSIPIGDIDPTSSFNNWKYDDSKHTNSEFGKGFDSSSLSSSGNFANNSLFNAKLMRNVSKGKHSDSDMKLADNQNSDFYSQNNQNSQNRIIQLLSEHAETVAERVLSKSGGEDFASDVNEAVMQWNEILKERYFELFSYIAILEILKQKNLLAHHTNQTNGQIWNLDVQDLKNEEEYTGMIKNIFKSLFKEKLDNIPTDDVEISPSVMALLQNGSNLALDAIEVYTDPITGKPTVRLKQTISLQPESSSRNSLNFVSRASDHSQLNNVNRSDTDSELKMIKPVISSISPIIIDSVWDGRSFSKDINSNSAVIIEVEETTSKSANLQNVLDIHDQSSAVQNPHSVLSHNQTPFSNDTQKMIYQNEENIIGDNNLTALPADKLTNKSFVNTKSSTGSRAIIPSSPQKDISKSLKQSKEEFVVGRIDETKDIMSLYSQTPSKTEKTKPPKLPSPSKITKNAQKNLSGKKPKQEIQRPKKKIGKSLSKDSESLPLTIKSELVKTSDNLEQINNSRTLIGNEENEYIYLHHESTNSTSNSLLKSSQGLLSEGNEESQIDPMNNEDISDEEIDYDHDDDDGDEENKERRILMRQQREAKRMAAAEKRRLDVDRKRREKEEQRKLENKRRELEETMAKKLEEQRRQMEDELRLKQEREKAEELQRLDALKSQEYLRLKQIERERKEKEEFNRRLEEMKIQRAIEDQKRKLEQERLAFEESERMRIENEMISRMRESERIQYLKNKAEEEERKRLREEEEKRVKEENARLALEEAQRIAQQQAREREILEAHLNFIKGVKIENEGLKKYLNVTPNFVWSYFEFLKILGLQPNPCTDKIEFGKKLTD